MDRNMKYLKAMQGNMVTVTFKDGKMIEGLLLKTDEIGRIIEVVTSPRRAIKRIIKETTDRNERIKAIRAMKDVNVGYMTIDIDSVRVD